MQIWGVQKWFSTGMAVEGLNEWDALQNHEIPTGIFPSDCVSCNDGMRFMTKRASGAHVKYRGTGGAWQGPCPFLFYLLGYSICYLSSCLTVQLVPLGKEHICIHLCWTGH